MSLIILIPVYQSLFIILKVRSAETANTNLIVFGLNSTGPPNSRSTALVANVLKSITPPMRID